MVSETRLVNLEQEPKTHHEMSRRQEILFAPYHEGPSGEVLSRGGSLGHLVMADPPSGSDYPGLPSGAVAHSHRASLIESTGRDGMTGWVLDNHTARPVEVRVDIEVSCNSVKRHVSEFTWLYVP